MRHGREYNFIKIKINDCLWIVDQEFSLTKTFKSLSQLKKSYVADEKNLISHRKGHHSWLYHSLDSDQAFFVKQYYPRNHANKITYFFRKTRANKEFNSMRLLAQKGIATPGLLAYGESRFLGIWQSSLLIFNYLDNSESLKASSNSTPMIKTLSNVLADEIAFMHDSNIYHGDLHSGNVLVNIQDDDPECVLVDFDKMQTGTDNMIKASCDELALLNAFTKVSDIQRYRFISRYFTNRNIPDKKQWLENINKETLRLWNHRKSKHNQDCFLYPIEDQT